MLAPTTAKFLGPRAVLVSVTVRKPDSTDQRCHGLATEVIGRVSSQI